MLPLDLQMPHEGSAPPAWSVVCDAVVQAKRVELAAVGEAAAERRARVAAAAPSRTVRVGGEGKAYAPSLDRPIPAKARRLVDTVQNKISSGGAICVPGRHVHFPAT